MTPDEAKIFAAEIEDGLPTLDLHGLYPDAALEKLDKFLYTMFQEKKLAVKIVYGIGEGVLEKEVANFLQNHPMVDTFVKKTGASVVIIHGT